MRLGRPGRSGAEVSTARRGLRGQCVHCAVDEHGKGSLAIAGDPGVGGGVGAGERGCDEGTGTGVLGGLRVGAEAALLKVVDAENPPLRVFFGTFPLQVIQHVYAERLKTWEEWADVSAETEATPA
ncbi:hypothetical protein [Saccharothrix sp. ALI-22-I]|uniref:hypothetical protein n=1 Tax=Saccharothrix sp. ALI-22-I TaxID=1933778 RepID=UPI001930F3B4|nr:hypothetical protein [Saccharothrix sp. ALI-22-I]